MAHYIFEKLGWVLFTVGLLGAMTGVITHTHGRPIAISALLLVAGVIILEFSDEGNVW